MRSNQLPSSHSSTTSFSSVHIYFVVKLIWINNCLYNCMYLFIRFLMIQTSWIKGFKIPNQYSLRTMTALVGKEKSSITSAVRSEIVSSIATLVMVNTMYPTPEEYTIISDQLVKDYPILADSFGCGFVSLLVVL